MDANLARSGRSRTISLFTRRLSLRVCAQAALLLSSLFTSRGLLLAGGHPAWPPHESTERSRLPLIAGSSIAAKTARTSGDDEFNIRGARQTTGAYDTIRREYIFSYMCVYGCIVFWVCGAGPYDTYNT